MTTGFKDIGTIESRDEAERRKAILTLGAFANKAGIKRDECLDLIDMLGLGDQLPSHLRR